MWSTPPDSLDDYYAALADSTLTINADGGVLANDSDIDGDDLTATLVDNVTNGTLSLALDGSFSYTPNEGFNSFDYFSYVASDGVNNSNLSTVSILVGNQTPVAVADTYLGRFNSDLGN